MAEDKNYERWKMHISSAIKISNESGQKLYSWIKLLVTLAVSLFGILVSLKSDQSKTFFESILFLITLTYLALGIVTACITLYGDIVVDKKTAQGYLDIAKKVRKNEADEIEMHVVHQPLFFYLCNLLCYIFLGYALISLLLYAFVSELLG